MKYSVFWIHGSQTIKMHLRKNSNHPRFAHTYTEDLFIHRKALKSLTRDPWILVISSNLLPRYIVDYSYFPGLLPYLLRAVPPELSERLCSRTQYSVRSPNKRETHCFALCGFYFPVESFADHRGTQRRLHPLNKTLQGSRTLLPTSRAPRADPLLYMCVQIWMNLS